MESYVCDIWEFKRLKHVLNQNIYNDANILIEDIIDEVDDSRRLRSIELHQQNTNSKHKISTNVNIIFHINFVLDINKGLTIDKM